MGRASPVMSGGWIYAIDIFIVLPLSLPLQIVGFAP
jgi:hypothetical protein